MMSASRIRSALPMDLPTLSQITNMIGDSDLFYNPISSVLEPGLRMKDNQMGKSEMIISRYRDFVLFSNFRLCVSVDQNYSSSSRKRALTRARESRQSKRCLWQSIGRNKPFKTNRAIGSTRLVERRLVLVDSGFFIELCDVINDHCFHIACKSFNLSLHLVQISHTISKKTRWSHQECDMNRVVLLETV